MKRLGWFSGIVGVVGVIGTAACTSTKTAETTPAPGASPAAVQVGSTLVDCGPGQRLLLMQANGVTQVRCTHENEAQGSLPAGALVGDGIQPYVVNARVPASVQAAPAAPRPATYEPRAAAAARRTSSQGRTWKKSAVIIGGSTAAGAGVGAILDGGSGAKKGAVVGLLGGVVYDIATRDR